ncbi:transcriptional regulator SlyA [Vibrio diazotrophicus]|jgi:MarR family transcriptional regulator for hemolysin|uniref:transcriptional regulator SlyA n=1 Tax=Vibrio diazotrophicus TaxID=685 RepID=UPI0022AE57AB|nr:transcriptional regulator SlyA [Vibrio diazotrophicus]MCZ4371741.1 transcriptional regulator SlyA [Vibrio diazotrophicus]
MVHDIASLKELSLAEQLSRVSRLWKMVADRELAPLGLTHPRWTALWKLRRLGDNVSQKCLAEALEIELPSLMRTLNQLEEQSLITRYSCKSDKRARIVRLTEDGISLLKQMEEKIVEVRSQLLNNISDEEIKMLSSILDRVSHSALDALSKKSETLE